MESAPTCRRSGHENDPTFALCTRCGLALQFAGEPTCFRCGVEFPASFRLVACAPTAVERSFAEFLVNAAAERVIALPTRVSTFPAEPRLLSSGMAIAVSKEAI